MTAEPDRDHDRVRPTPQAIAPTTTAMLPERLQRRAASGTLVVGRSLVVTTSSPAVQLFADAVSAGVHATQSVQQAAAHGLSGASSALPHATAIQHSFGRHDVGSVRAHVGGRAAEGANAMGAHGYAAGNSVAFAASPDLHLAAHEAAHVVQQRAGVHLKGGVGEVGDAYERHADAVADLVVQGKSAESLLDTMAPSGAASGGVQLHAIQLDEHDDRAMSRLLAPGEPGAHHAPHAPAPSQRDQVLHRIDQLTELAMARQQLALITANTPIPASGTTTIQLVLGGSAVVAIGEVEALRTHAEHHVATLQVATRGTSLSGLASQMPPAQLAELTALVQRYAYGSTGGIAQITNDLEQLGQLTSGLSALDPVSAASIRQAGTMMRTSLDTAHLQAGESQIGLPHPGDESMAEHEERADSMQEAGHEMAEGLFASLFFTIATISHAPPERAATWAHVGHQLDHLVEAGGLTAAGVLGGHEPGGYDAEGHEREPPSTITHSVEGHEPTQPQPEHGEAPPVELADQSRAAERRATASRQRQTQRDHATRPPRARP